LKVGDISPQDSSIVVTSLLPDHGYIVRMFAVNALGFVATSEEILIQTKPASSGDFYAHQDGEHAIELEASGPKVKPYMPLLETVGTTQAAGQAQREHSGSISHVAKRFARRQTNPTIEPPPNRDEPVESSDNIRELTERLDRIRAEKESMEQQIKDEEDNFKLDQRQKEKALADVQQQNRDKNDESRKLNQRVRALESEELTAKKRQAQVDKQLHQALQEREKIKNDMSKWEIEANSIEEQIKQLAQDEEDLKQKAAKDVTDLKQKLAEEILTNKSMEENIRQMMAELKDIEEDTKRIEDANTAEDAGAVEAENEWRLQMAEMGNLFTMFHNQLQAARGTNQMAQSALDGWKAYYYTHQAAQTYPQPFEIPVTRRDSLQRRAPSLRDERSPPTSHAEMPSSSMFASQALTSTSPNFGIISPYFNFTNGMTIPHSSLLPVSPDVDQLTGGAPTSPSAADNLLPSGLLGDESEFKIDHAHGNLRSYSIGGLDSALNNNPNILPGLGAPEMLEELNHGPSSPASIQSRSQSASAFTSPQQSLTHLPQYIESDRRSVRSNTSINRPSRFANLFHLGRQRGKPDSEDGAALGALALGSPTASRPDEGKRTVIYCDNPS
jgi:chemotaxis protein histidine kinase CheA